MDVTVDHAGLKHEKRTANAAAAVALMVAALLAVSACVERSTALTSNERALLEQHVRRDNPSPKRATDIIFKKHCTLIGYDAPERVSPGVPFTVTWYWKVRSAFAERGWRPFTHIEGSNNSDWLNLDNAGVLREPRQSRKNGLYAPDRWKAGDTVLDAQTVTLPLGWRSDIATFYLGFFRGDKRLDIGSGPSDGDQRAQGLRLRVDSRTVRSTPQLDAHWVSAAPQIDGKLTEAEWRTAPQATMVHPTTGAEASLPATVRLLWNNTHLFLGFEVQDPLLQSSFTSRDDPLWTQDTVEWMVDPGGDGRNYFELQVSPRGTVFDTRYDTRRNPGPSGHSTWNARIQAAADAHGTVDDSTQDDGYSVEVAVAWESFAEPGVVEAAGQTPTPEQERPDTASPGRSPADAIPKPLRMNFYVMSDNTAAAGAWSPPLEGDFHVPHRFGTIVLKRD